MGLMRSAPMAAKNIAAHKMMAAGIGEGYSKQLNIAYIGDSLSTSLNEHYFFNFNPFIMRSDAPALCQDVEPEDVMGSDAYPASITLYADGTATWTAPGDAPGPRTNVQYGSDRQLVYLESDSPDMGMGIYFTQSEIAAAAVEGTVYNFYIIQALHAWVITGYSAWAQALSGWRFELSGSYGISGNTTEDLIPRLGDIFAVNSVGQPIARRPDVVVVNIGINGCNDLDLYNEIRDYIVERGSKVIFCTLAQEAPDGAQLTFINSVNSRLASLVDRNTAVADFFDVSMDGGSAIAGTMDDLHYTPPGALEVGKELNRVFVELFGERPIRSSFLSPSDTRNIWPEGMMVGESGALTGMTGVSAIDATYSASGAGTCVASIEEVIGGNDWQVFTITGASFGDGLSLGDGEGLSLVDVSVGELFKSEIEMDVSGAGLVISTFASYVRNDIDPPYKGITSNTLSPDFDRLNPVTNFRVLHRTPVTPVPSWATDVAVQASFLLAEGDTVIKLRRGGSRKV